MDFLIQLSFDTSGNYIADEHINGKESWFAKDPHLPVQLNSRLRKVYAHDTIECYLILVNYFDYKVKAPIPEGATLNDLFNTGKFYHENSDIDSVKKRNDEIFNKVSSSLVKTNNRSCIVLSFSNFQGVYDSKKLKMYTLFSHTLFTGEQNTSSAYLNKIYDGLMTKLNNNPGPKYRCGNNIGIAENTNQASVVVYPNPSNDGKFTIQSSINIDKAEIYDLTGRMYKTVNLENEALNLKGAENGIYLYKMFSRNQLIANGKLVITK